jgi:O-acetyl-ADP-ribose deacetylase (regulator of RNase III)
VSSLAIPAISSGIFGYPKDLCAKDIFEAIETYAFSMNPGAKLKHIRITIIDDETITPFKLEFIERYKLDRDYNYREE